jgi:hypothetical protein
VPDPDRSWRIFVCVECGRHDEPADCPTQCGHMDGVEVVPIVELQAQQRGNAECEAENWKMREALWACLQHSGADASGWDGPHHPSVDSLCSKAVEGVKDLRRDYDEESHAA